MAIRGIFERPPHSRTWWISYCDVEGKRHREKVGPRSAALDRLARRRMEVKDGRFIPPKKGASLTFRELSHAAMAQKKLRLAPLSFETDMMRLGKLLPLIGNVPADRLTPARVEETLGILRLSVSPSTANRYHSLLSSIYAFAVKSARMSTNPLASVKRYRENSSKLRWLNRKEEKSLRTAIKADRGEGATHEAEFDLALNTGMRRGEQFFLEWRDCDLKRGKLTVKGKTGVRHVEANRKARAALRRLHKISGARKYVSPDARDGIKRDARRWLEHAVKGAGIDHFRWHDLRHTFASRLVMAGVDVPSVQKLLGHKSITMTMRYAHLAAGHLQAAVEKLNEEAPA